MNVVIFGASGLIGQGVLLETLDDRRVGHVLTVGRRTLELSHPKLRQIVHADLLELDPIGAELRGLDACFWCLGAPAPGMSEADYTRVTYDYTMTAARALKSLSPGASFLYVSGAGTKSSERSMFMWARVKGRTENALGALGLRAAYSFRPGLIKSTRSVQTRRNSLATRVFFPLLKVLGAANTNADIGKAMVAMAANQGGSSRILSARAINRLAARSPPARPRMVREI